MTRAFSLLEVLIALALVATTLIAVILMTVGLPDVLMNARRHREGRLLASEGFLREMARGPDGFPLMLSFTPTEENGLTTELSVTALGDGSTKQIESSVSWRTRWGLPQHVTISGFATDYKNASGYACSPFLVGDWTFPLIHEFSGSSLPQLAALATNRKYVIAAATSTPGLLDPSLFVFRGDHVMERIAVFDSATSTKTGYIAVAATGTHVFALSAHTCPQSDRCAALDTFSLLDDVLTLTSTTRLPPGRSMAYRDGHLYIGLRSSTSEAEFLVFDTSVPDRPTQIGSIEIGDTVNDIAVDSTTVYLGTADNSAAGDKALMAFDIRNLGDGMLPLAQSHQSGAGISQRLVLSGSLLFLGRSSLLNSKELYVFKAPDIQHALVTKDTDSSVAGILVRGSQVFTLTRSRLDHWQITEPGDLELLPNPFLLPSGTSGIALACNATELYVAANESGRGRLMRLSGV